MRQFDVMTHVSCACYLSMFHYSEQHIRRLAAIVAIDKLYAYK